MSSLEEAIPKSKAPLKEEYILNPALSNFVLLDQISKRLGALVKVEEDNKKLLHAILKEERDGADEGMYLESHGPITNGKLIIINMLMNPGHSVKGYYFKNDGPNDVRFAPNLTPDGVTLSAHDIDSNTIRFITVKTGEIESSVNNRNRIHNIYIYASNGDSSYRLKLVW
jgi:hypothetical protein